MAIHGHKDIVASSIRQIEVYCCPTLHGSGRQEFGTLRHGVFVVDVQGVGITGEFGSAHAGTDHTGCSPILVAAHSLYGESILDDLEALRNGTGKGLHFHIDLRQYDVCHEKAADTRSD